MPNAQAPSELLTWVRSCGSAAMNDKPHILMLEDKPADAELFDRVLRDSDLAFQLERVETQEQFEHALEVHPPDVILSDHGDEDFDSLSALQIARSRCPDIPFILVTASAKDPVTVEALERGADAFVTKDHLLHWVPKLKRSLKQAKKEARHVQLERALTQKAERSRKTNAELEDLVTRRTRELQAATKELEAFGYSISHDLRAPLRHINAFIFLLEQSLRPNMTEESRRRLQVVASAAEHLGRLVDDLLSLSRVGRQDLRKVPVSLNSLLLEAQNHIRDETAGRKIDWVLGDLPVVQADPIALRQVFVNLLSNAVKYSTPRPVARIEVSCRGTNGETVCFVRDNGVGFDMHHASKLFGVFQRLHSEREFEGTGIGLAIVRRIIHRHGGRVWAEGTVDKGATFYFSLPKV